MIRRLIPAALRSVNLVVALLILAIWAGIAFAGDAAPAAPEPEHEPVSESPEPDGTAAPREAHGDA